MVGAGFVSGTTVLWAELRRGQVDEAVSVGATVLLPIGAIEQHGPHLPLNLDSVAATQVCVRAARSAAELPMLVLPTIAWGLSPYWMGFAGTITLRPEVLLAVVTDICTSVGHHGFSRLVIVNGHSGNEGLLQGTAGAASTPEFRVAVVSYWNLARAAVPESAGPDGGIIGHAGETESSIALFLQPELVDLSAVAAAQCVEIPIARRSFAARAAVYESPNPALDAPHGVYGQATSATAERGGRFIAAAADGLVQLVREFRGSGKPVGPATRVGP